MTSRLTIAAATAALFAAPAIADNHGETGDAAAKMKAQEQQQSATSGSGQSMPEDDAAGYSGDAQSDGDSIMTFNRNTNDVMTGDGQLSEQDRQMMAASQQQVREQLEDSGFEDVTVRRAAYLVTAMSPDGEPVMMLVDTSRMGRGQGGAQDQQGQTMNNQQSMQQPDDSAANQ